MALIVVASAYGSSVTLSLPLLHHFRAKAWYWHVLSVAIAFMLGFMPLSPAWIARHLDLMVGLLFLFFLLWGACAPFFRHTRHHI
jgi:hypothetical protein